MYAKFLISLIFLLVLGGVAVPAVAGAVVNEGKEDATDGYVPCGREDKNNDNIVDNPCGFSHLIELGKRIIVGWIMAGVIIAALGFSYAGFLYIPAMGSQEKISHAHSIFVKTFFGFVFMLSAWLIAKVFESNFLRPELLCNKADVAKAKAGDPCYQVVPESSGSLLRNP